MNDKAVVKELVAVAKLLAAKKGKYSLSDIQKVTKGLEDYVRRGGRDYGDFQFNIKLYRVSVPDSITEEYGESTVGDASMMEAGERVNLLAEEVNRKFLWVGGAESAGRSGGWFVVKDDNSTMDALEQAEADVETRDELDKDDQYFEEDWREYEGEITGAVDAASKVLKDLAEIEKMVKAGIRDYEKDMESERWWKEMRL